jgi:hypothetical protein
MYRYCNGCRVAAQHMRLHDVCLHTRHTNPPFHNTSASHHGSHLLGPAEVRPSSLVRRPILCKGRAGRQLCGSFSFPEYLTVACTYTSLCCCEERDIDDCRPSHGVCDENL